MPGICALAFFYFKITLNNSLRSFRFVNELNVETSLEFRKQCQTLFCLNCQMNSICLAFQCKARLQSTPYTYHQP